MNRTARDNRPHLKPVTKVKLSEEHVSARLCIVVLLVAIAAAAFTYAVFSLFRDDPGWVEIEADTGSGGTCADEFVFLYELGTGDVSATAEKKALALLYTETAKQAYQTFNADMGFEGVSNVYELNRHPNEILTVDETLYSAFALLQSYGDRNLYLAPIYARYDDMFSCNDDAETFDYDPYQNSETAKEYQDIASYAADPEQVDIRLLGDSQVCLYVSEEYLTYAGENGITSYIDFFWMKNAFIVDYLADALTANGYTRGTLSSYDGFIRNLDDRDVSYSVHMYDRVGKDIYDAAVMEYSGACSLVSFRDYKMVQMDSRHYYEFADGETRTSYLDIRDGKCKSTLANLTAYSREAGCARVLLKISPVYIADELDTAALEALGRQGIFSVYCKNRVIYYNDGTLCLTGIYDRDGVSYTSCCSSGFQTE